MKSRARIMIIDDDHSMGSLLEFYLENAGFKSIALYYDSKKALEEIINVVDTEDKYDLIICDWKMPICTGLDVLKELRSDEEADYTEFMLITSETNRLQIDEIIKEGADGFMLKPFAEEEFITRIREFLPESKDVSHKFFRVKNEKQVVGDQGE